MSTMDPSKAISKEELLQNYFSGKPTTVTIKGETITVEAVHPSLGWVGAVVECSDGRVFELEGPADDEHMHLME